MSQIIAGVRGADSGFDQQKLDVGDSETAFPAPSTGYAAYDEIHVQSLSSNADPIFIGKTGVTSDGANGGIEVLPGTIVPLPFKNHSVLKAIAANTGNDLLITYLKREK